MVDAMSKNSKLFHAFEDAGKPLQEEDQKEIKAIWEKAATADPAREIEVTDREISEAFSKVKSAIDTKEQPKHKAGKSYFTYAVAAVFIFFAVGLSYLLIPVTVEVPNGQTEIVELPDQSTVHLNSGSQISYSRLFNYWNREIFLKGEAFFDVSSNGLPFRVTTPNAAVEVLGTKFNVHYRPSEEHNRTTVFLAEGRIAFESLITDGNAITLHPGQKSWVSDIQQKPSSPVETDKEKAMDWKRNSFAFENQSLSSVFSELSRRFNISIDVSPAIAQERMTIYLSQVKKPESIIKDICRAKGLSYKKQDGTFLIFNN